MDEGQAQISRRRFLAAAACIPALAVGAVLAARRPAPLPLEPELPKPQGAGYHETEHIRAYYRSAAF